MIKASVILATAFCLTRLLRNRAAAERHVIWVAAIVGAAMLPGLSLLVPSWQPALAQRVAAVLPAVVANPNPVANTDVIFRTNGIETTVVARIWPVVWFTGSMAGLLIFSASMLQQKWLARRSSSLFDGELNGIARDLARRFGCRRTVRLRRSLDQPMPMTWGVFRPQILVPEEVNDWTNERKRIVLAHEMAHVQRLDWFFQMVAQIACAVYWFNPLFWIASNRLHRESEHACDDVVINLGIEPREYASHLLEIARTLRHSGRLWSTTLAVARPSALESRFAALLKPADRRAATGKTVFSAAAFTLFFALPLAAIRVSSAAGFPAVLDPISAIGAGDKLSDADSAAPQVDQYTTPPLYSDEARMQGIEGIVTLQVRVGADGRVQRLQIVKGLGHGLDENALLAVRDWVFVPARRGGTAVEATTRIDVEFNLRNAALNEEIANDMATRVGPGVTPPQVVHRLEPLYAPAADRSKPSGAVILDAVIPEDGIPKIVRVIRSLDWALDEIAINALEQWRFSPAMKDGRPVKVRMNIAVSFGPS